MKAREWSCVDYRDCPRGYSVGLLQSNLKPTGTAFTVVLYLDGSAYWQYPDMNEFDARDALDELEILPGPRGDSSWLSVLSRCMLKESSTLLPPPTLMTTKEKPVVGTWQWLTEIKNENLNRTQHAH